ncbi:hypothetical protein ACWCQL_39030 [Streptomyces sp. NPDC002073]
MTTRTAAAALALAAALAGITGCSSGTSSEDPKPSVSAPPTGATTGGTGGTNGSQGSGGQSSGGSLPDMPTGSDRANYLAALRVIDPSLAADEEKALDRGRNQCASLSGDDPDGAAQQRFGTGSHEVTRAEAIAINGAVRTFICPRA